jgi:hypothetical protein
MRVIHPTGGRLEEIELAPGEIACVVAQVFKSVPGSDGALLPTNRQLLIHLEDLGLKLAAPARRRVKASA